MSTPSPPPLFPSPWALFVESSRGTLGPDHPLIQAIDGETTERASIEVLNFPTAEGGSRMREVGRERSSGGTGGGGGGGDGGDGNGGRKIFDELRSAVVFREWFDVGQQKVGAVSVVCFAFFRSFCFSLSVDVRVLKLLA